MQAPQKNNTMVSKLPGFKIETKPVADHGAEENARKGAMAGSNRSACNYAMSEG